MNKLYFGDNLDILREHPPRRTDEPTRPMKEEAVSTGFYDQDKWGTEYHRNDPSYKLQILTIEGLMSQTGIRRGGRYPDLTLGRSTFKRAAVEDMGAEQGKIL